MTTSLNFGQNARSSLEVYRISLQQAIPDQWDAVHKTYLDGRLTSLKAEILGADISPMFDTLREIQLYLETNNLSGALLTQISALTTDLATERSERVSADNLITTSINNEVSRATGADASLSLRILDEQKAREASDNSLRADLTSETSTRVNADNLLSGRLDDEKKQRETADLVLDGKITTVDAKADTYYGLLTDKDNQNMNTVYSIQSQLETKINTEKSRAEGVEASKFDKAGGLISGAVAVSGALTLNLSEATNTYLNLSPVWRVVCSNTGDRVEFQFYKDNQWTVALPFIMGV